METRANYVWVGAVSLVLLALLAAFIVWLAQLGTANRKEYDIFFEQSVGGLANGSEVTFQGVPAGEYRFYCLPHLANKMTGIITVQ